MRLLSDEYLACLIDTEGCLGLYMTKKSIVVHVTFTNTYAPLVYMFRKRFGGSIHRRRRKHHCFSWVGTREGNKELLRRISPYLLIKKKQAKLLSQAIRHIENKSFKGRNIIIPDKVVAFRQNLVTRCKNLNQRSPA